MHPRILTSILETERRMDNNISLVETSSYIQLALGTKLFERTCSSPEHGVNISHEDLWHHARYDALEFWLQGDTLEDNDTRTRIGLGGSATQKAKARMYALLVYGSQ